MIRLSGYTEEETRIKFVGLRPGEKLYEELLTDNETTVRTTHAKLRIACALPAPAELLEELHKLFSENQSLSDADVRALLKSHLEEYVPETPPSSPTSTPASFVMPARSGTMH